MSEIIVFLVGFCTSAIIFFIAENKNSLLVKISNLSVENYNLKKDVESKNNLINSLLDTYSEQGLIDEYEIKQIKRGRK